MQNSKNQQLGNIEIPNRIIAPHKFTKSTKLYFAKLIKNIEIAHKSKSIPSNYISIIQSVYRGRMVCCETDCFKLTVSKDLVSRALNFLDALTKELEIRGFKIKSLEDKKAKNFIVAIKDNDHISYEISEGYKYQSNGKDPKELTALDRVLYSGKEPVPTGKLTFSAYIPETNIVKNWTDGKSLIETKLPAIINGFSNLGSIHKQYKIDQTIREEKHRNETTLFRESESRRYLEKSIYDNAMQEAQIYKAHTELETYLNHLEVQYLEQYGPLSEKALYWLSIARKIAKAKCPANNRLKQLNAN